MVLLCDHGLISGHLVCRHPKERRSGCEGSQYEAVHTIVAVK